MKLRNKKTGEIISSIELFTDEIMIDLFSKDFTYFNSRLKKILEEWEDYEDSKDHWHIGCEGDVFIDNTERYLKSYFSIGNDFETREEAEKAVEKLKAWKRLKEAGYYFTYDSIKEGHNKNFILRLKCKQEKRMKPFAECESNYMDLKLIFGGEDE